MTRIRFHSVFTLHLRLKQKVRVRLRELKKVIIVMYGGIILQFEPMLSDRPHNHVLEAKQRGLPNVLG